MADSLPIIALTLGDVAGVGPEVVVRACSDARVQAACRPLVIGHPEIVGRALRHCGFDSASQLAKGISCWNPPDEHNDVLDVPPGSNDARRGRAAYAYLVAAARMALDGKIDAITTAPLSKAALHLGGHKYPGQTEILAEVCGVRDFGMMLYLPREDAVKSRDGLGVVHVTLHTSLRSVPELISTPRVAEKIELIHHFMQKVGCVSPRIAVCALNPHAGEQGLFGDEESRIIAPAVSAAVDRGIAAIGPLPADTLFRRAAGGEFDAVVAMYHDQGHIAFKLLGIQSAVNVTLGLPIVRTSPSHGTAFDIAWKSVADPTGMIEAVLVAASLARSQKSIRTE